ncbi:hypothetical protein VTH06DRAFT_8653 [Thermothelomyces fergusii]
MTPSPPYRAFESRRGPPDLIRPPCGETLLQTQTCRSCRRFRKSGPSRGALPTKSKERPTGTARARRSTAPAAGGKKDAGLSRLRPGAAFLIAPCPGQRDFRPALPRQVFRMGMLNCHISMERNLSPLLLVPLLQEAVADKGQPGSRDEARANRFFKGQPDSDLSS